MARSHPEDHIRYEQLLESTRDSDGVCHRDEAVKLLTEELAELDERVSEYASSRAMQVADGFDNAHKPETVGGQMALDINTYLVIGDSERVAVTDAKAVHTRQWIDIQASSFAKQAAAWAAKDQYSRKLLAVQDEQKCSMWDAEQILRGAA